MEKRYIIGPEGITITSEAILHWKFAWLPCKNRVAMDGKKKRYNEDTQLFYLFPQDAETCIST